MPIQVFNPPVILPIDTAELADGAVTEQKLAATSVATAKIQDGAVTTTKIANASVDKYKIVRFSLFYEQMLWGTDLRQSTSATYAPLFAGSITLSLSENAIVVIHLSAEFYGTLPSAAGEVGIGIDGVVQVMTERRTPLLANTTYMPFHTQYIGELLAGVYVIQGYFRRVSGTGIFAADTNRRTMYVELARSTSP